MTCFPEKQSDSIHAFSNTNAESHTHTHTLSHTHFHTHTHTHTHTHFRVQGLEKGVSENETPGPVGAHTHTHTHTQLEKIASAWASDNLIVVGQQATSLCFCSVRARGIYETMGSSDDLRSWLQTISCEAAFDVVVAAGFD